jgi:hypothetical protein
MDQKLFISCIFGKAFTKVHCAPHLKNSYFFTNNSSLEEEIIGKGWKYIYVSKPLLDDDILSSLQSKYIKFLQFLPDFPEFKKYDKIIYWDHKEKVLSNTLLEIDVLLQDNPDKALIIRTTPRKKIFISDEVNEAKSQPRYAKNMNKTIEYIDYIKKHGLDGNLNNINSVNVISEKVRICNTGLLIYNNYSIILELLDNVYNKCIEHEQPECQIYWAIFCQKIEDKILKIDWKYLKSIQRVDPL